MQPTREMLSAHQEDKKLTPLTEEEVRSLPFPELVRRMDAIREGAALERFGSMVVPLAKVADIFEVPSIQRRSDNSKRKLADAAFRFLFQLDLLLESGGIENAIIFNDRFDNNTSWQSPRFRMKYAVLNQYNIIASRIALECFFELLHVAHKDARIDSDKKFKAFKKWILERDNPYQYFLGHIIEAHSFDRTYRTPEVHGTSRYVHDIMCLQTPNSTNLNLANTLTNILINVWPNFLQILNGEQPTNMPIFSKCRDFALVYINRFEDSEKFEEFFGQLAEQLK